MASGAVGNGGPQRVSKEQRRKRQDMSSSSDEEQDTAREQDGRFKRQQRAGRSDRDRELVSPSKHVPAAKFADRRDEPTLVDSVLGGISNFFGGTTAPDQRQPSSSSDSYDDKRRGSRRSPSPGGLSFAERASHLGTPPPPPPARVSGEQQQVMGGGSLRVPRVPKPPAPASMSVGQLGSARGGNVPGRPSNPAAPGTAQVGLADTLRLMKEIEGCGQSPEEVLPLLTELGLVKMTVDILRRSKIGVFTQRYKAHKDERVQAQVRVLRQQWKDLIQVTVPRAKEGSHEAGPPAPSSDESDSDEPGSLCGCGPREEACYAVQCGNGGRACRHRQGGL